MPGPDRIPYIAWKRLGDLGTDTLFEAATALQREDAADLLRRASRPEGTEGDHDFDLGDLCCLPKKKTGEDPDLGEYYAADATRPLTIVNTDNRVIAGAFRLRWEPILINGYYRCNVVF